MTRTGRDIKQQAMIAVSLAGTLLLTLWAFWPGLTGPFLFDDFPNLSPLGLFGGVHDTTSALRFIFGGNAGPLGRPISLASFLIDDHTWPTDPWPFKYTNLLLHALSGVFLFCFLRQIRLPHFGETARNGVALATTGWWLLHPIQAAPIFLVVQRMTILSAMFSFAAMALWLMGRNRIADNRRGGWIWMSAAIVVGGLLATLSKENGALLPLLIWATDLTVAPLPATPAARRWKALFLWTPSALLAGYFVVSWPHIVAGYQGRSFSLEERLLTEPLILLDYIRHILLPGITTTIFRDDFHTVTSPSPIAILVIAGWLAALLGAWLTRKRLPPLSFAILLFIAGQILESGPIGLELYFIHRNYLPMIGILYALTVGAYAALHRHVAMLIGIAAAGAVLLGVMVRTESTYWGSEDLLVNAWAAERPASPRAAAMAANYWGERGQYAEASKIIERTLALHPDAPSLQVGNYYEHCLIHQENRELWDSFAKSAAKGARDNALEDALDILAMNIRHGACKKVGIGDIVSVLDALKSNPHYSGKSDQSRLDYAIALYFLELGNNAAAVGALEEATEAAPTVYELELLGDLYAESGQRDAALAAYKRALAIPYFRGWKARLLGVGTPNFGTLKEKLHRLESEN